MATKTVWYNMIRRCTVATCKDYPYYGGRGITVCEEWSEYRQFRLDMGRQPVGLTLERIDNSKGYSKENCKWATRSAQNYNKRSSTPSSTGIVGVTFCRTAKRWKARSFNLGIELVLYRGKDFFEACCARKSYEASRRDEAGTLA